MSDQDNKIKALEIRVAKLEELQHAPSEHNNFTNTKKMAEFFKPLFDQKGWVQTYGRGTRKRRDGLFEGTVVTYKPESSNTGPPKSDSPQCLVALDENHPNFEGFIRAFWRRIDMYKNDYGKELPEKLPVPIKSAMITAMMLLRMRPGE